ncbi:hypothetical protein NEUTE2DRAFT_169382 [Neurospora tetrasperma FGSC 2509]|nr:hypothetical protein NEUTE2DRAFT_169382 [Neurospora tetrasperma FGSC 2509]
MSTVERGVIGRNARRLEEEEYPGWKSRRVLAGRAEELRKEKDRTPENQEREENLEEPGARKARKIRRATKPGKSGARTVGKEEDDQQNPCIDTEKNNYLHHLRLPMEMDEPVKAYRIP